MKRKINFIIEIEIIFIILLIVCQYSIWRVINEEDKKVILTNTMVKKQEEVVVLDRLENSTFVKDIDKELLKIIIEKEEITQEELKSIYMKNSLSRYKYLKALYNLIDLEVLEIYENKVINFKERRENKLDGNENKIIQLIQENEKITVDELEELFLKYSVSNTNYNLSFKRLLDSKIIKIKEKNLEKSGNYDKERIFIVISGIVYLLILLKIIENYKTRSKIDGLEKKVDYIIESIKKEKDLEKISLKLEELKITTSDIVIILAEKIEELKRKLQK